MGNLFADSGFVDSGNYTNAQNTKIISKPLHVIQLIPGIKISKTFKSWKPYLRVAMAFTPLNKSQIKANEVVLPDSKMGNFVEYGFGIQKLNENKSTGFLQVMVRNGSRTGINFKFGIKHPLGKKPVETL